MVTQKSQRAFIEGTVSPVKEVCTPPSTIDISTPSIAVYLLDDVAAGYGDIGEPSEGGSDEHRYAHNECEGAHKESTLGAFCFNHFVISFSCLSALAKLNPVCRQTRAVFPFVSEKRNTN